MRRSQNDQPKFPTHKNNALTNSRQLRPTEIVESASSEWDQNDVIHTGPAEVADNASIRGLGNGLEGDDG